MKVIFPRIIYNKEQLSWDWSGSITNLKQRLQNLVELEEENIFLDIPMKVHRKLVSKKVLKNDFNTFILKTANKKIIPQKQAIYLTVEEIPFKKNHEIKTYIYQDLSVAYLKDVAQHQPNLFRYSGFQSIEMRAIDKRLSLQNRFYQEVDKVFSMSQWLRDYMIENHHLSADKIVHVGGGINVDPSTINERNKKGNKFLFVGKDFIRKGGDLVYHAFCYLQKNICSEAELYIIGPSELPFEIKNEKVYFLGSLPADEVQKYFNLCDVFVLPSRFEAYGLVFIEALTFGLPCIGRDIQEMPYFIDRGKTGELIEADDEDSTKLAHVMYKVLTDLSYRKNVQEKRSFYLETYHWEAVANRMLQVFEEER